MKPPRVSHRLVTVCIQHRRPFHVFYLIYTHLHFSQLVDQLMAERKTLTESLDRVEQDLSERNNTINKLQLVIRDQNKGYEDDIARLTRENDEQNKNILELSSAKKEAMDKIRGLEEEVSDADGAIDDAKSAIETLLEEKRAADSRISDLKNERSKAEQALDEMRKQMAASKKEQEAKLFKIQEENEELNHAMIVLKMEKKEGAEKITTLEREITEAETAIGDAKSALQKLLNDKEEAIRRIDDLEEDCRHFQSTIDAMTQNMSQVRVEYETKIDNLMAGLATAREVHASRSVAGSHLDQSRALVRTESRMSSYSIPEARSQYKTRDSSLTYSMASTASKSRIDSKKELAVDVENMSSIASELTDLDRPSVTSSLVKYAARRTRSVGRAGSMGRIETSLMYDGDRNSVGDSKKSIITPPTKSADSRQSNLDLARSFLSESGSSGGNSSQQRARSRSRPRLPQDRDAFDDSKSIGGQSLGGKSRSSTKGGNYDGSMNSRGERHGYGVFVAGNGNEYEGEWKNDKRDGEGTAKYNTGDVYIGSWKNCKRHGHGTMYVANGDVYEGAWDSGFKDGPGLYRWKDGEVDISRYSSDYRVGEGARWSADKSRAFRLVRGNVQGEIDLGEAARIANNLGLSPP